MDKYIGIVISVDSTIAEVAMYDMVNDANILWEGQVLPGPKVGSFISILQGNVRIIAKVISEKIIDQQNSIGSKEFDNRYSKDSINRVIKAKSIGTVKGGNFQVTSRYVPMVGNKVSWISQEDYAAMYALGENVPSLRIGEDLLGDQEVNIPINRIFASHIGVFGNTGSGKSNTLHRLYLNLFKSEYGEYALENSKFIVIDFNGEYSNNISFGVDIEGLKEIVNLGIERSDNNKLKILEDDFLDPDLLSNIFSATAATQAPFIKGAINNYINIRSRDGSYGNFFVGAFKKMIQSSQGTVKNFIDEWADLFFELTNDSEKERLLKGISFHSTWGVFYIYRGSSKVYFNDTASVDEFDEDILKNIADLIDQKFDQLEFFDKVRYFLKFSKIHACFYNAKQKDFLEPLFRRIDGVIASLVDVVSISSSSEDLFSSRAGLTVVNLLHVDRMTKNIVPMILCKSAYLKHKLNNSSRENTTHLIIDEAHNILNAGSGEIGDYWRDYRLDIFEEIIKEGRKFGFYLTLSSQRPADISPTIVSQIHNYFIHRLVNEIDLRMIERTMPTLDRASFDVIPTLGKGECVVTGTAFSLPVFTIVDWDESDPRPHSDDLILTDLWIESEREAALKKAEFYSDNMYMSKQGIYSKLTSKSERFTHEAAQYAVDNMEADWKANALEIANSCQGTPADIYSRLTSDEEGFTEEEATYAVSHLD